MRWTPKQEQIIGLRNRNLLVAAAAGSGKTAVLVERIMAMITDPEKPVDIDRLLVVTFTRAAAGQMRERIGRRLSELLEERPKDRNLRRQEALLPRAKIMTIDSFCLYVVRNYFPVTGIDPEFRIGDQGELRLLREDAAEALLEAEYEAKNPAFLDFVERYAAGKGDEGISDLILRLFDFADAYPDPGEQLSVWRRELSSSGTGFWTGFLLKELHEEAESFLRRYEAMSQMSLEEGIPPFAEMFESDARHAKRLLHAGTYEEMREALSEIREKGAFMRQPRLKKDLLYSAEKKEFLAECRKSLKESMGKLAAEYDLGTEEQMEADLAGCAAPMEELLTLAEKFRESYRAAKEERNLMDFQDVAHAALEILTVKGEDGRYHSSGTAKELREGFYEIMIDEYQDSNRIQEEILTSISGMEDGKPNMFMVGDVKQSIYKFRQARPELFMEKYGTYTEEDSLYQKIDLHQNFRSREQVLGTANFFFGQLMEKSLGGITYDEAASLIPGREFPKQEAEQDYRTELLFFDTGKAKKEDPELEAYTGKELEAKLIIGKIRELTDPETGLKLTDRDTGTTRTASYRDIAVLLRTMEGWAETFVDQFMAAGIPAYAQTQTGYFSAKEVRTLLNLLKILDNPMQDIPLAAVLMSPIGGFTPEELAKMKAAFNRELTETDSRGLYGALCYYAEKREDMPEKRQNGNSDRSGSEEQTHIGKELSDPELQDKAAGFLRMLRDFRERAVYLRLHQLLRYVLETTGYGRILAAMPGGKIRTANVEMLIRRAIDYEATSYHGVFQFVRYIDRLRKYSVDFGEASPAGEGEDAVQITSIHKSKGLEYPIVILAGTGKGFNQKDSEGPVLLHPELGIGADHIDPGTRMRAATIAKKVLKRKLRQDSLGEELRVLYVAMTRAEEKLIITGTEHALGAKLKKWKSLLFESRQALPFQAVSSAGAYLEWLIMGLQRSRAYEEISRYLGETIPVKISLAEGVLPLTVRIASVEEMVHDELGHQTETLLFKKRLMEWTLETEAQETYEAEKDGSRRETAAEKEWKKQLSWQYPHAAAVGAPRKFSVSELKMEHMEEIHAELIPESEQETGALVPRFLEETEGLTGAARGTAYHRLLELLPFTAGNSTSEVREAVEALERQGLLPEHTAEQINLGRISRFLRTPIGRRMTEGERNGTLRKEQQFVMGIPAEDLGKNDTALSGETVLIQGIIDAWFEEPDGLVIVDYKTDRVKELEDPEGELIRRYQVQLEYYARALHAATGKPVKQRYLYSFSLGKEISV